MSLIKDVRDEVKLLPLDRKSLRKFGILVGGIFIVISFILFFNEILNVLFWILIVFGGFLFLFGLTTPMLLSQIYLVWMTGAIVLGWFMSRIILTILFFIVLTPISIVAKIVGKKFLNLKFKDGKPSYWIIKNQSTKIDYKKMF